jgi:hypothetical protein
LVWLVFGSIEVFWVLGSGEVDAVYYGDLDWRMRDYRMWEIIKEWIARIVNR